MQYKVILFYKFVGIKKPEKLVENQKELCTKLGLKGRMLVATEGVNATFEGRKRDINKYKRALRSLKINGKEIFKDIVFKESIGTGSAFTKLEIKVRKEVITLGRSDFNVKKETAKEMTASELERLYKNKKENFVILDLRNDFEINVGQFENTINPRLQNFRDLPNKIKEIKRLINPPSQSSGVARKIVTVCTGGIRCEKATCLLKREDIKNLYQLKDGIHTYMQKYPNSHFKGSLFVFDNRMTTPVVDVKGREIIGKCIYCDKKCEDFYSNDTVRPSRKVICCKNCIKKHSSELRSCTPN